MLRLTKRSSAKTLLPQVPTLASFSSATTIPIHTKGKELGIHYTVSDPKRIPVFANGYESAATIVGSEDSPTLVCVHGCPGSTFDWRYLGAKLEQDGVRVIRLTIPGHDVCPRECSKSSSAQQEHLAAASWEMVDSALTQTSTQGMSKNNKVFIMGHSLGCETVAAMVRSQGMLERVAGVALIAPVGMYPHKSIRPFWLMRLLDYLGGIPFLKGFISKSIYHFYVNMFGFPKRLSLEEVMWCQKRVASRDFEKYYENMKLIADAKLPLFVAYASDDQLIERPVFHTAISAALGDSQKVGDKTSAFTVSRSRIIPMDSDVLHECEQTIDETVRGLLQVHEYEQGGHNLIKSQSEPIGADLLGWIKNVVQFRKLACTLPNHSS